MWININAFSCYVLEFIMNKQNLRNYTTSKLLKVLRTKLFYIQ